MSQNRNKIIESIGKWIKNIRLLNPKNVKIYEAYIDTINVEINGRFYYNVKPRRPFPYTHPEYIIFYTEDDKEIGILSNYRKLDRKSKKLLEKVLNIIYYIPKIKRIIKLDTTKSKYEWRIETDRGEIQIYTWSRCTRWLPNGKLLIYDVDGNVYMIENLRSLDSKSKAYLDIVA
ncbi:MAG: hypothetical protein DRJ34_05540 [Thermoprotei archaeon]|nr:MAG: hypothetical protein DRJ34_05540 [Thermoprotei archaeon]